jgi:hypothetical protein
MNTSHADSKYNQSEVSETISMGNSSNLSKQRRSKANRSKSKNGCTKQAASKIKDILQESETQTRNLITKGQETFQNCHFANNSMCSLGGMFDKRINLTFDSVQ